MESFPYVAPFAGAWIEMALSLPISRSNAVAPFAGAWIEISVPEKEKDDLLSLPSRERGLKFQFIRFVIKSLEGRSLRGSVD